MYAKKQSPDASASISLSISPFLLHPFFFSNSILREDKLSLHDYCSFDLSKCKGKGRIASIVLLVEA